MGRRKKAAKKAVKKKRPVVAKVFKCLRCGTNGSVHCTLDHKLNIGQLECNVCKIKYANKIHKLTQPIDLFTEWLDAAIDLQANNGVPRFEPVEAPLTASNLRQRNVDRGEDIRDDEQRSVDSKSNLSDNFIEQDDDMVEQEAEDDE